jgi:hypothetical protein
MDDYGRIQNSCCFKHESDPSVSFSFPVLLNDNIQPPRIVKVLQFQKMVGKFKFRFGVTGRSVTWVHALNGATAGALWQHNETDENYIRTTNGPLSERPVVELAAMMGCVVPKDNNS